MQRFVRLMLAALPILLAACDDHRRGDPEPPPASIADDLAPDSQPPAPPTAAEPAAEPEEEELVVEVDPEISGTEPMDSAAPMAEAGPMTEEFGEVVAGEEPAE